MSFNTLQTPPDTPQPPAVWPAALQPSSTLLQTRSLSLTPLEPRQAVDLAHLLGDAGNARLFTQIYEEELPDLARLTQLFVTHQQEPKRYGGAYTIVKHDKPPSAEAIGWVVINPLDDSPVPIFCALFLSQDQRMERGSEVMYIIFTHVFEVLQGHEKLSFRTGSLGPASGQSAALLGIDFLGIIRRQMIVPELSQESDLYVVRKAHWPGVKAAVGAWLDAREACMKGI